MIRFVSPRILYVRTYHQVSICVSPSKLSLTLSRCVYYIRMRMWSLILSLTLSPRVYYMYLRMWSQLWFCLWLCLRVCIICTCGCDLWSLILSLKLSPKGLGSPISRRVTWSRDLIAWPPHHVTWWYDLIAWPLIA